MALFSYSNIPAGVIIGPAGESDIYVEDIFFCESFIFTGVNVFLPI
jgi:hypothetical protein